MVRGLSDITDETDEVCKVLYIEDKSDNILLVKRILGRRAQIKFLVAIEANQGIEMAIE